MATVIDGLTGQDKQKEIEYSFINRWDDIALRVRAVNQEKGWWSKDVSTVEQLALVMTEVAEAIESQRIAQDQQSEHIPKYLALEEELADVVIRIMDLESRLDIDVASAVIAKIEFNKTRPYRHGGKLL